MSLDEKKLLSDFESYLRGEEPQGVEFATAPRLYDWAVLITKSPGDGSYRMTLTGTATGHPTQHDGRHIQTSPVVWLDRDCRWARTVSRLYVLEVQKIEIDGVGQ
jgi:hypothetical protein